MNEKIIGQAEFLSRKIDELGLNQLQFRDYVKSIKSDFTINVAYISQRITQLDPANEKDHLLNTRSPSELEKILKWQRDLIEIINSIKSDVPLFFDKPDDPIFLLAPHPNGFEDKDLAYTATTIVFQEVLEGKFQATVLQEIGDVLYSRQNNMVEVRITFPYYEMIIVAADKDTLALPASVTYYCEDFISAHIGFFNCEILDYQERFYLYQYMVYNLPKVTYPNFRRDNTISHRSFKKTVFEDFYSERDFRNKRGYRGLRSIKMDLFLLRRDYRNQDKVRKFKHSVKAAVHNARMWIRTILKKK